MVERLKEAIEKARRQREAGAPDQPPAAPAPAAGPAAAWDRLPRVPLDPAQMRRQRFVSFDRGDPAHVVFDVLRTRVLKACRPNGWTRIGMISQTPGCGKTFVALNLAMSVARLPDHSAVVVDLDLKAPHVAKYLGLDREARRLREFLLEDAPLEAHFVRVADRMAVGLNARRETDSAEVLQNAAAANAMNRLQAALAPTLLICDLPPLRVGDDALALLDRLDAAILVAAAGETTPAHIAECERVLVESVNFLGVVLNKHDADVRQDYHYDYDAAE